MAKRDYLDTLMRDLESHTEVRRFGSGWLSGFFGLLFAISGFLMVIALRFPDWFATPQLTAVKTWAVAHLLAIGNLANVVLFGSFLVWAALSCRAARSRDRVAHTPYPPGTAYATVLTVLAGAMAWAGVAFWAHGLLIGIRPL